MAKEHEVNVFEHTKMGSLGFSPGLRSVFGSRCRANIRAIRFHRDLAMVLLGHGVVGTCAGRAWVLSFDSGWTSPAQKIGRLRPICVNSCLRWARDCTRPDWLANRWGARLGIRFGEPPVTCVQAVALHAFAVRSPCRLTGRKMSLTMATDILNAMREQSTRGLLSTERTPMGARP